MLVPVQSFLSKLQRSVNLVRNWPTILIFRIKNHTFSNFSPQKPPYPRISGSEGCCPLKVLSRGANVLPAGFQALKVNFRGTCAEFRALRPLKIC